MAQHNSSSGSGDGNIRHENGDNDAKAIEILLNTVDRSIGVRLGQIFNDFGNDGVNKAICFIRGKACSWINTEYREYIALIIPQRFDVNGRSLLDDDDFIFNVDNVIDYLEKFEVRVDPSFTVDEDNTEDGKKVPNFVASSVVDEDEDDDDRQFRLRRERQQNSEAQKLKLQNRYREDSAIIESKIANLSLQNQVILNKLSAGEQTLSALSLKLTLDAAEQKKKNELQALINIGVAEELRQNKDAITALQAADRARVAAEADCKAKAEALATQIRVAGDLARQNLKDEANIVSAAAIQREKEKAEADIQRETDAIEAAKQQRLAAIATAETSLAVKVASDEDRKLTLEKAVTDALTAYYKSNPPTGVKQNKIDKSLPVYSSVTTAFTARGNTVCIPKRVGKCLTYCCNVVTVKMHTNTFFGMLYAGQQKQYDGNRLICTFCKDYSNKVYADAKAVADANAAQAVADDAKEVDAKAVVDLK